MFIINSYVELVAIMTKNNLKQKKNPKVHGHAEVDGITAINHHRRKLRGQVMCLPKFLGAMPPITDRLQAKFFPI